MKFKGSEMSDANAHKFPWSETRGNVSASFSPQPSALPRNTRSLSTHLAVSPRVLLCPRFPTAMIYNSSAPPQPSAVMSASESAHQGLHPLKPQAKFSFSPLRCVCWAFYPSDEKLTDTSSTLGWYESCPGECKLRGGGICLEFV